MKTTGKRRPILVLNGDLLGLAAGGVVGGIVLGVGFFWQTLDTLTTAVRAGFAGLITYVSVFLLTKYVLNTLIYETAQRNLAAFEQATRPPESTAPSEHAGETK